MASRSLFTGQALFGVGLFAAGCFAVFRIAPRASLLQLEVLDVGQGDGLVVHFPNGAHWLVDVGGRLGAAGRGSIAARTLVPSLRSRGIRHIETVIVSHPDEDHVFGLADILSSFSVGEVMSHPHHLIEVDRLIRAERSNPAVVGVERERRLVVGGVTVRLLPISMGKKRNDTALLVWLEYAGCQVLLSGDIEAATETRLTELKLEPLDFLKVAHHGSLTSSRWPFLLWYRPQLAVISVGATNRYGHPHPEVVQRFRWLGTQLLYTARHGYVSVEIPPQGPITCRSAKGFCGQFVCRSRKHLPSKIRSD